MIMIHYLYHMPLHKVSFEISVRLHKVTVNEMWGLW